MLLRIAIGIILSWGIPTAWAGVIVVQNGSDQVITCTVEYAGTPPIALRLDLMESRVVRVGREPILRTKLDGKELSFKLDPYHAYLFAVDERRRVGFTGIEWIAEMPAPTDVPEKPLDLKPLEVKVKLVGDDKDRRARMAWEKLYAQRLASASALFERSCGVKFELDNTAEWGPSETDLEWRDLQREFEANVKVKEHHLALGFTLRAPAIKPKDDEGDEKEKNQLDPEVFGRLSSPWSSHLLLRDDAPESEAEREEVLVHFLARYLGGVITPDPGSALRSNLNDGLARHPRHKPRLDPLNQLIIAIWADEIRAGKGRTWRELRPLAADRLWVLYKTLAKLLPDEPMIADAVTILEQLVEGVRAKGGKPAPRAEPPVQRTPKAEAIRTVVQAITAKAAEASKRSPKPSDEELTGELVRAAAASALGVPENQRTAAFLVGLGIALDDSTLLRSNPLTKTLCTSVETDDERTRRLEVLGSPTLRTRRDLCQHFAVSMALTDLTGAAGAELAGVTKELLDMKGTSGFSFADLAADLAGIELAKRLQAEPKLLEKWQNEFRTSDYMPTIRGLREGLSEVKFKQDFGSTDDPRYKASVAAIRQSIAELPGWKK
jgi:hypothetical protein